MGNPFSVMLRCPAGTERGDPGQGAGVSVVVDCLDKAVAVVGFEVVMTPAQGSKVAHVGGTEWVFDGVVGIGGGRAD